MQVALDFNNIKDVELVKKFKYIGTQLKANVETFRKPWVDPDEFLDLVDRWDQMSTVALDGGKKAISQRNRLRKQAIDKATFLGRYVESVTEDAATVYLSGYEPKFKYRRLPQGLPKTRMSKVVRGPNSGTAAAYIVPFSRSKHGKVIYYELRYAPKVGSSIGEFTVMPPSAAARFGIPVKNLTPGTLYIFQGRAYNKKGANDWSDPVSYIAT